MCLKHHLPLLKLDLSLLIIIHGYEAWKICIRIRPCLNILCNKLCLHWFSGQMSFVIKFQQRRWNKTDLLSNFHNHLSNLLTIYTVHTCRKRQKQIFLTTQIKCSFFKVILHRIVKKTMVQFVKDQYEETESRYQTVEMNTIWHSQLSPTSLKYWQKKKVRCQSSHHNSVYKITSDWFILSGNLPLQNLPQNYWNVLKK
jgi:hypothetical protein